MSPSRVSRPDQWITELARTNVIHCDVSADLDITPLANDHFYTPYFSQPSMRPLSFGPSHPPTVEVKHACHVLMRQDKLLKAASRTYESRMRLWPEEMNAG